MSHSFIEGKRRKWNGMGMEDGDDVEIMIVIV